MTTQELLNSYYASLSAGSGWEAVLAEDFRFIGGDMTKQTPTVGRETYQRIIQGLSRRFSGLRVVKSFVDRDEAFVLVEYDWTFPHDVNVKGGVAERWKVKNGKLQELTIFFDTGSFDRLVKA